MGPDATISTIPSRPRFAWDAKSPPWTDGKGNQEKYKIAVEDWKDYHDTLPDTSPNKVIAKLQGIILKSQLYGQAADQCSEISREQLKSADGVRLILNAVYRRDFMSVISEAYDGFSTLLNTKRGQNESLKGFETRFSAAVSKFNSFSTTTKLPQCITALMLLSNASIEHSQRVSALSAAAPAGTAFSEQASNDDFLSVVTYNQVSSIVKQCEKAEKSHSLYASSGGTSGTGGRRHGNRTNSGTRKPSVGALKKMPCHACGKFGHWKSSHRHDGSLSEDIKSFDTASEFFSSVSQTDKSHGNDDKRQKKSAVTFNMARGSVPASSAAQNIAVGPLVDDGAEYSAIGVVELKLYQELCRDAEYELDPIPASLNGISHWQYGMGRHASDSRPILGSTLISLKTDKNRCVNIRHLVIEGSSQWVIGRNVTSKANILHMGRNAIQIRHDGGEDHISLINQDRLSYVPLSSFNLLDPEYVPVLSCLNGNTLKRTPWKRIQAIVDKVHRHVCGHANFTDIRLLLERNDMWNDAVSKYVSQIMEGCTSCRKTAPPQPSRKVSISSLSQGVNDVICIDHFYLDGVRLFHAMDLTTRFSAAFVVSDATMDQAILAFESCWLSQFWTPNAIRADMAFVNAQFEKFCTERDIQLSPVPPRRHNKNAIESKHGIIRTLFLKLLNASPDEDKEILAIRAVTISNDLYGNDTLSAFELAKGYTKPVSGDSVLPVPDDVLDAQLKLAAKRKLALILKSKATFEQELSVGDMVEIYNNYGMDKKGVWSTPKIVLAINHDARTIVVPGKSGKRVSAALEDVRLALPDQSFAQFVQEAIDAIDDSTEDTINNISKDTNNEPKEEQVQSDDTHDADFSGSGAGAAVQHSTKYNDSSPKSADNPDKETVSRGDRVQIYWPIDNQFYCGTVRHLHRDGNITVLYDDGENERLDLDNEVWRAESNNNDSLTDNALNASIGQAASSHNMALQVHDAEPDVLTEMLKQFGNKPFLKFQAQGFEQFVINQAYDDEEKAFMKTVKVVHRDSVPKGANVVNSHTLYKVKTNDDGGLKLKARIAPHGNEDNMRAELSSDCATCPPHGLRIIESISSLKGWTIRKADAISAFLQTGAANRDVYVKPPRESKMRSTYLWLLLTAAYGLVNANAKWQVQSDEVMFDLGLTQCQQIPQLFYRHENGKLVLIVAKIVDDLKASGDGDRAVKFIENFNKKFKLGTVCSGPGKMRFFGINLEQADDYTVRTDADDKLNDVIEYQLTRVRRKQSDDKLNEIEKASYASTNSSLGWIGMAASPFCSVYASLLQQKAPDTKVRNLIEQVNILRKLKRLGTTISYPRPKDNSAYDLTVLAFSDASKSQEHGQIGILTGLLVGEMKCDSIYHPISWISHKSKRPAKSVPAAEIMATSECIDEVKVISHAYMELMNIEIRVQVCVDSKDLFTSLSTQRNSVDRSIRSDVACIRYEFQTGCIDAITWIPGKLNLADVLTKSDSPLTDALQLTLYTGRIQIDFGHQLETKQSKRDYG